MPPALAPIRLILGFPRPIQAARILKDLTSLGVSEILLTGTELGEKSYAQSSIFKDLDFRCHLLEGAEQAGNPRLPARFAHWSLRRCLEAVAAEPRSRPSGIFLHPYGEARPMGRRETAAEVRRRRLEPPVTLAIGSERGWSDAELAHCGGRLRSAKPRRADPQTETAALAAMRARLGRARPHVIGTATLEVR